MKQLNRLFFLTILFTTIECNANPGGGDEGDTSSDTVSDASSDSDDGCRTYPTAGRIETTLEDIESGTFTAVYDTSVHSYAMVWNSDTTDETIQIIWTYDSLEDFVQEDNVMGKKYYLSEEVVGEWIYEHTYNADGTSAGWTRGNESEEYTEWDEFGRPTAGVFDHEKGCFDSPVTITYDETNRTATKHVIFGEGIGKECWESTLGLRETFDEYNFRKKSEDDVDGKMDLIYQIAEVTETEQICLK